MVFCKRCGNYYLPDTPGCPKCGAGLLKAGHESSAADAGIYWTNPKEGTSTWSGPIMEPPGHVRRITAILIDCVLELCIAGLGGAALIYIGRGAGIAFLLMILLAMAYEPFFTVAMGATLGKRAMGLRVVNEYGEPVSAVQSIARWLVKRVFNGLVIPIFVPLFSHRRRALHDIVVSTYVVQA